MRLRMDLPGPFSVSFGGRRRRRTTRKQEQFVGGPLTIADYRKGWVFLAVGIWMTCIGAAIFGIPAMLLGIALLVDYDGKAGE